MNLKPLFICSMPAVFALPVFAEDKRELDAHEHGHGTLNIAIEGYVQSSMSMLKRIQIPIVLSKNRQCTHRRHRTDK